MGKSLDKSSNKFQYFSMFLCWFAYVSAYFGRYSYSANIAMFEKNYGGVSHTHAEAGLVMTFFAAAYGIGQLFHGVFCKYYPRRYVVSIALLVAAISDILVFVGVPFAVIKYLWLLNAVCQAVLWPMLLQIISENVGTKLMKSAILVMSTTTSFGTFCIYGMSAAFAKTNYLLTFLVGSFVLVTASIVWFIFYKPGAYIRINFKEHKESRQTKRTSVVGTFIFTVVLLIFCSIVTNFNKDGLQTWVPVILKNINKNLSDGFSILLSLVLPLFGIFGATVAVFINKKIKPVVLLVMFFMAFTGVFNFLVIMFQKNMWVVVFCFGILELCLHGIANAVVSIFPLAMRDKMSPGALAGILNGSGYLGSALSSWGLGKIADVTGGWNAVFLTLLGTVVAVLIFGGLYIVASAKNKELMV